MFSSSTDKQVAAVKTPPHALEAEQAILGGVLRDNDAWDKVSDFIGEEDFYRPEHRVLFLGIQQLVLQQQPCDVLTLSDSLRQHQKLDKAGGETYIFQLADNAPSVSNITAYAKIVRERSVLRQLINIAHTIADSAFQPEGREAIELVDQAEQAIFKIAEQRLRSQGPVPINTIMAKTLEKVHTLHENKGSTTGLTTGFKDLDDYTSGLQAGDLIIVAGRPSMGKTMFSLNIAENAALELVKQENPKAVLFFSLEMPAESLVMRMLSSIGRVDQQRLRTGRLQEEDWPSITSTIALFSTTHLLIDDTPALSPAELRARARRTVKEYGSLALIVVDYLQLMRVPGYGDNRVQEVSEISRSLKALAKELNVPIIALSQLNRSLEQRQVKRPVMSDIRESGAVEQDADLILFLYRDEVYHPESNTKNIAEVIIGKHRNGPIGDLKLRFEGNISRFDNLAKQDYERLANDAPPTTLPSPY